MTKYVPLNTAVMIALDPVEEVTEGGIVLARETVDKATMDQVEVTIIAVGPYAWHNLPDSRCEVGDRVVVRRYAWTKLPVEGDQEIVLINDVAILARVEHG